MKSLTYFLVGGFALKSPRHVDCSLVLFNTETRMYWLSGGSWSLGLSVKHYLSMVILVQYVRRIKFSSVDVKYKWPELLYSMHFAGRLARL